jgi:riboflavin synthase
MFTGLILAVGDVRAVRKGASSSKIRISAPFAASLALGESVASNGVCLTVTRVVGDSFEADASSETLARTTLQNARVGSRINLERAMTPSSRLGGHLVSGHVDGIGMLVRKSAIGNAWRLDFSAPAALAPMIAEKGSITIDGISLTVNGCTPMIRNQHEFNVTIVPHTWENTTLSDCTVGTSVNLEVDLIARYVARLLEARTTTQAPTLHAEHDVEATLRAWPRSFEETSTRKTTTQKATAKKNRAQKDRRS